MALPWRQPRMVPNLIYQGIAIVRSWPWSLLGVLVCVFLVPLGLWGYQASARPAMLVVDGTIHTLRTHERLVGGVLEAAGLAIGPGDLIVPSPDSPWRPGQPIVIQRSYVTTVRADGRQTQLYGRPNSVLEALSRAGITLRPGDDVYVNAVLVPESSYADTAALTTLGADQTAVQRSASVLPPPESLQIEVVRAVALRVQEDGVDMEVRTTATTVGEALEEAGFVIYRADQVYPALSAPVRPGLQVRIARSFPVRISADGRTYSTHTRPATVADLLAAEGVPVGPRDRVEPPPETALKAGMAIRVVRVTTVELAEQAPIPYRELQEPDPSLELDQYHVRLGEDGLLERVTRVTYQDGVEMERELVGERVVREPTDQVLYYGTRIVVRTMDTPDGPIEYWRKIRVWATSYFPSTCDKELGHPLYGITYTGKWATRGIIAVDPRVIRLHTRMYVPGYGFGQAEDIGGAVKGRHIDLCYDDADQGKGLWDTHYVDVYLLTPVPPPHQIPWVLP